MTNCAWIDAIKAGVCTILILTEIVAAADSTTKGNNLEDTVTTSGLQVQTQAANNGKPGSRAIDRGLQPLYVMTDTFLDLIQPNFKENILENSHIVINDEDFEQSLKSISQSFKNNWQLWMRHYISYSICLVVGVIFIVVMPIIGTCFCLCRCCGRCRSKRSECPRKDDGCRRSLCGIILIVFTTLLMAGMICTFVTNDLIQEQTSVTESQLNSSLLISSELGILPAALSSLQNLERYKSDLILDLENSIRQPIQTEIDRINEELINFPEKARNELSFMTNLDETLSVADLLASSLENISDHLQLIQEYKSSLVDLQNQLNSSLNESKTNILNVLPPECQFDSQCVRLRSEVQNLQVSTNFSEAQNLSSHLNSVRRVIDDQFRASIEKGKMSYRNFTDKFLDQGTQQMKDRIKQIQKDVNQQSDSILALIDGIISQLNETLNQIDTRSVARYITREVTPKVNEYGRYRYYVGIGLGCMLLLWVIFTYLGLCFGACGESVGDDSSSCCNRGNGARFLMVGVAFIFFFSFLLMIVVMVLFAIGGAVYTEACHPLLHQHNSTLIQIGDMFLASKLNDSNIKVTIVDFLQNCEANEGVYSALNLEPEVNLTGQLEELQMKIKLVLDDMISQINPDLSSIEITNSDMMTQLNLLKSSQLDFINFTSYNALLSRPITSKDLFLLSDELHNATKPFQPQSWAQTVDNEASKLRLTASTIVASMQEISKNLTICLAELKNEIYPQSNKKTFADRTEDLIETLNNTQSSIQINGSIVIKQFVSKFAYGIYNNCVTFLHNLKIKIQTDVFQCKPLYDIVMHLTTSVCQTFLRPFDGLWFSIGWCLFFSIPIIVVSVILANLYRKVDYYGSDFKSLDDPLYDAYTGGYPVDRIPLDDVHARRQPSSQLGHQNLVYQPDNATPPASSYLPFTYDSLA